MTWKLQAIVDELAGKEILIERDMLIGRHQSADLVLQSAEISRKHAAFLFKEDALWIQDLGSSNGTFVNDVQVNGEIPLSDGDSIRFASLKFLVTQVVTQTEHIEQQAVTVATETEEKIEQVIEQKVQEKFIESPINQKEEQKTVAEQMNEQGMPELTERDATVKLTKEGMPQGIAIPQPAPIPEGVDVVVVKSEPVPVSVEQHTSKVEQKKEVQQNVSVGLITIIVLIIVAFIAWLIFK